MLSACTDRTCIFHLCSSFAYIPSVQIFCAYFPDVEAVLCYSFHSAFFTASHDPSVTAAASAESFDHCRPRRPSCSVPALTRRASSRRSPCFKIYVIKPMLRDIVSILHDNSAIQERLGVLAAPRKVRSTFLFARLRSAGGFYSSSRDCTHDEGKFHFARVSHD